MGAIREQIGFEHSVIRHSFVPGDLDVLSLSEFEEAHGGDPYPLPYNQSIGNI
jgi:hypothetical protein